MILCLRKCGSNRYWNHISKIKGIMHLLPFKAKSVRYSDELCLNSYIHT